MILQENWVYILIAIFIGILVGWIIFARKDRVRVETDKRDALDADGTKAARNQALIDAAPAAGGVPASPPPAKPNPAPAKPAAAPEPAPASAEKTAAEPVSAQAESGAAEEPAQNEPAASAAKAEASAESAPAQAADSGNEAAMAGPDDLTQIKGIGPRLAEMLNEMGVSRLEQIANWNEADVARIDAQLGRFQGRIERDSWVRQAQLLTSGDTATYEENFGKLG